MLSSRAITHLLLSFDGHTPNGSPLKRLLRRRNRSLARPACQRAQCSRGRPERRHAVPRNERLSALTAGESGTSHGKAGSIDSYSLRLDANVKWGKAGVFRSFHMPVLDLSPSVMLAQDCHKAVAVFSMNISSCQRVNVALRRMMQCTSTQAYYHCQHTDHSIGSMPLLASGEPSSSMTSCLSSESYATT